MNNCLLSNYFCIILNLYRNQLLVSFIDQCYSSRSAAHDIIFTSLRRAHCRLSTTIAVELNRKLEFDPHDQMFISIAVYYYQYLQKKKLFRGNRFFHDYYFLISAILICFSISILLKTVKLNMMFAVCRKRQFSVSLCNTATTEVGEIGCKFASAFEGQHEVFEINSKDGNLLIVC